MTGSARATETTRPGYIAIDAAGTRDAGRFHQRLTFWLWQQDDRELISETYGTRVHRRNPARIMVFSHRSSAFFILTVLLVGCAQSPSRPGPERKPSDASEIVEATRPPATEADIAAGEPPTEPPAEEVQHALTIQIGSQTFAYSEGDQVIRTGPLSSGRDGHRTPRGNFSVLSKQKDKVSSRYTNELGMQAWMPYAIQFYGHYFLHEGWLPGYPDSHGCVRVGEKDARFLFERLKVGDPVSVVD
ncbi:L,D-transpeptidase family protein [Thiocapsa sp.]|uniref:L,D-transpeptidase n=1 Tax=Thiocapsa sp. TaxID=2024551 RepID=UPI0035943A38